MYHIGFERFPNTENHAHSYFFTIINRKEGFFRVRSGNQIQALRAESLELVG